ncbi:MULTISPECIES: glycosyltransferase family 2 protein [unclassified Paracoccus (in: a-proteobacteria)]|uniref:glycosyltransferase family 2 protein n=1 Tax=unclassified Paracoccus (in: a-proteobacteria) TaxID=2688777 RepID=UPI0020959769|nr:MULTISPECIES: glycosyltransferase family 2 protein [unclassified Paracoccus (in: a-proteobacteria)]MCO6363410.1 glycosyltransferase family 2 protein [Paracoccus sp. 08]
MKNSSDYNWQLPAFETLELASRQGKYALVIPVINEGERIHAQLARIAALKERPDTIVADGGSTDGSLDQAFLVEQGVRTRLTKTGPGKLSAQLRMAYAYCLREGYEGVITIDGNGKDGVDAIAAFVARLDAGDDYVQGSRYALGGQAVNTPLDRAFANRMIHAPLLSLASGKKLTDTTNGFRAYSARFLLDPRVAPFRSVFDRYELLFYLTVRAGQLKYRVSELPVLRAYPEGEKPPTKINGWRARLSVLRQTVDAAAGRFNP